MIGFIDLQRAANLGFGLFEAVRCLEQGGKIVEVSRYGGIVGPPTGLVDRKRATRKWFSLSNAVCCVQVVERSSSNSNFECLGPQFASEIASARRLSGSASRWRALAWNRRPQLTHQPRGRRGDCHRVCLVRERQGMRGQRIKRRPSIHILCVSNKGRVNPIEYFLQQLTLMRRIHSAAPRNPQPDDAPRNLPL